MLSLYYATLNSHFIRADFQAPGNHPMLDLLVMHCHNQELVFQTRLDLGIIENLRNIV